MTAKTLMIMGTHSNAGKSMLVTALCRIFARQGYRVAPFKAQNMALNAGVTPEGHEIGRSTIAQAEAAGVPAHVDMNPILLKPEGDGRSQVILDGRPYGHIHAQNWHSLRPTLWAHVTAALERLRARNDLIIIEGAGSPAEINLKHSDIVNMRVALHANAPVLLVGDIDRGGVFAALVGTMVLLEPAERALIKAFVMNKFRGDISLLGDGLTMLQSRAFNTPTLGVIPYLPDIGLAAEDSVSLDERPDSTAETGAQVKDPESVVADPGSEGRRSDSADKTDRVDIVVIRLPRIANFDDFDPLAAESGVQVRFVSQPEQLGRPDAIILPGTKMTLADLDWLHRSGLSERIISYAQANGRVIGICGGYQMLGQHLSDPDGIEAAPGSEARGLDLLPLHTTFAGDKHTVQVRGHLHAAIGPFANLAGLPLSGYEIHMGRSEATTPAATPLCAVGLETNRHFDGLVTAEGRIWGTYLHGIFDNDAFRHAWLHSLGWSAAGRSFDRQRAYNRLADHVEAHLNMAKLHQIIWG